MFFRQNRLFLAQEYILSIKIIICLHNLLDSQFNKLKSMKNSFNKPYSEISEFLPVQRQSCFAVCKLKRYRFLLLNTAVDPSAGKEITGTLA